MKWFLSTVGCVAAILIGVAAMSVDTWSNIEFQAGRSLTMSDLVEPGLWTSLTAAVVVVAISTAAALTVSGISWRSNRLGLAIGLFAAFLFGAGYSLSATLDRVASSKDDRIHKAQSHNVAISEAKASVSRWETALATAKAGIAAECKGRDPAKLTKKGWPMCVGHYEASIVALDRLTAARAQRGKLGALVVEDSGAERVAAMLPFLSSRQVTLYQPVLLPAALFLFGNLLVAFGFGGLRAPELAPRAVATAHAPMKDVTPADPVVEVLSKRGRPVNNGELAGLLGWSDATAHRRVAELVSDGKVSKTRNGREVVISLL
jgi:hypothetical protein